MSAVTCHRCRAVLNPGTFNQPGLVPCPSCQTATLALVFPAFHREMAVGQAGEALLDETEASCFYHPQKKASVPCDRCGRFLCALCDLRIGEEHICPACLETGRTKGQLPNIEKRRILYDGVALALVIYPTLLFCWMFFPITALAALVVTIRYWKTPGSLVRPTKLRYLLAIVGAVLQLVIWTVAVVILIKR